MGSMEITMRGKSVESEECATDRSHCCQIVFIPAVVPPAILSALLSCSVLLGSSATLPTDKKLAKYSSITQSTVVIRAADTQKQVGKKRGK